MLFPEVEKVTYKINSIESVTCQIHFPPIMKIENEGAVSFQAATTKKYPKFSKSIVSFSDEDYQTPACSENKKFMFCSEDEKWRIILTNDNLSISTDNYQGWEDLKDRLQIPVKALVDLYQLDRFNQVSLRSIYKFVPSRLGLKGAAWKSLVDPCLLGVLASESMVENIENLENISFIQLTNRNTVLKIGTKIIRMTEGGELCLMLDEDLSEAADRGLDKLEAALNHLNAGSTRMFRWCIKDRLHKAMKPETN